MDTAHRRMEIVSILSVKGYSTITSVRDVVKPAFQMAYNEDIIRRNPFDFIRVDVVPNDSQKRIAMTAGTLDGIYS